MIEREHWGPPPEHWIRFAVDNEVHNGGILSRMRVGQLPDFDERAREAFKAHGFPVHGMTEWINIHAPRAETGYEKHYPHTHCNNDGLALILYLQAGDKPAPLDVFDGDEVVESIYPEPGLALYMPDGVKHGARINNGTTKRIAFVVMAHRK